MLNYVKNIFLDYMQKLAVSTNNVDSNHSDDVLNILKDLKSLFRNKSRIQVTKNLFLMLP